MFGLGVMVRRAVSWISLVVGIALIVGGCDDFHPTQVQGRDTVLPGGFSLSWMSAKDVALGCVEEGRQTPTVYETGVKRYDVCEQWIVGETDRGWFVIQWKTKAHRRYSTQEAFDEEMARLGIAGRAKLHDVSR